jgi:hypothetical protein
MPDMIGRGFLSPENTHLGTEQTNINEFASHGCSMHWPQTLYPMSRVGNGGVNDAEQLCLSKSVQRLLYQSGRQVFVQRCFFR